LKFGTNREDIYDIFDESKALISAWVLEVETSDCLALRL
jgi:hypothetical protein